MIRSFLSFLLVALFVQVSLAKDLGNIFTGISFLTSHSSRNKYAGTPFGFYDTSIAFYLDVQKTGAAIDDTFSLRMPDVFEARRGEYNWDPTFSLTSEGVAFASCSIIPASARRFGTAVDCKITEEISRYKTLSGDLNILLIFDGGARRNALTLAQKWKVGSNEVTFNDAITGNLQLTSQDSGSSDLGIYTMFNEFFLAHLFPESMCSGGVESGVLTYAIKNPSDARFSQYELFIASSINAFGQPTAATDLPDLKQSLSSDSKTLTVSFGAIPEGKCLFFDAFISSGLSELDIEYDVKVKSTSGEYASKKTLSYKYTGSNRGFPKTVTIAEDWSGCDTVTEFITGAGSTVTEVIKTPATKCVSLTPVSESAFSSTSVNAVPSSSSFKSSSLSSHFSVASSIGSVSSETSLPSQELSSSGSSSELSPSSVGSLSSSSIHSEFKIPSASGAGTPGLPGTLTTACTVCSEPFPLSTVLTNVYNKNGTPVTEAQTLNISPGKSRDGLGSSPPTPAISFKGSAAKNSISSLAVFVAALFFI